MPPVEALDFLGTQEEGEHATRRLSFRDSQLSVREIAQEVAKKVNQNGEGKTTAGCPGMGIPRNIESG